MEAVSGPDHITETFWHRLRKRLRGLFDTRVRAMTPHEVQLTDNLRDANSLAESLSKQVRDLCREREELQGRLLTSERMIVDLGDYIKTMRMVHEAEAVAHARSIVAHRAWLDEHGIRVN